MNWLLITNWLLWTEENYSGFFFFFIGTAHLHTKVLIFDDSIDWIFMFINLIDWLLITMNRRELFRFFFFFIGTAHLHTKVLIFWLDLIAESEPLYSGRNLTSPLGTSSIFTFPAAPVTHSLSLINSLLIQLLKKNYKTEQKN